GEGPIEVDGALLDCLDEAITMAELTQGYFNPTIGAVSDVYEGRFEQSGEVQQGPSAEALEAARKTIVPYAQLRDYIVLDQDAHTVDLRPYEGGQYRLSLSAIGKGYALAHLGFSRDSSYLINAGTSSMRGHLGEEEAHEREPISWNIATHVPDGTDILFAFKLGEASVSVSGDDENYYLLEDGTRVHHILNPFTGTSENYWRNVVLVGEDAGVLDALSTALFNIEDEQLVKEIIRDVEQSYGMTIDYCFVREEDAGTFQLRGSQSFLERILPDYNKGELNPRMFIMDEEGNEAWQSM
ncbi:MAG: FAD:protein FMN transferase, partial [Eggerthellaceae bacterium]|nr:FAD:protein FMN transferase [Eggerthellaceae bacterium]